MEVVKLALELLEGMRLDIRWEAFNVLNHANFLNPGVNLNSGTTFGIISTASDPRIMQLAAKFNRPIITLLDTPGAYPGIDAEERGQAEAIARNLREMARLPVPVISVCIGEGGSGGALAIAVAARMASPPKNQWLLVTK